MSEQKDVQAIIQRLRTALDALESAVERRREADAGAQVLVEQVHELAVDRSKLAADLDLAAARSKELETANREIATRIDVAMTAIRSVISMNEH